MDDFEVITWFPKGNGGGGRGRYSERESIEYYRALREEESGKFCCDTIKIL